MRWHILFLSAVLVSCLPVAMAEGGKPKPKPAVTAEATEPAEKPAAANVDWRDALPEREEVAKYLQDISVTIKAGHSEGSGVVYTREMEIDGKPVNVNFVWTAAHVVDGLRSVKTVIVRGTNKQHVTFSDAQVVKELVEDGRRVGELKMDAEVIKYGEAEDLALLRIRKTDFVDASVVFCQDEKIPPIGTALFHVGSLQGQMGANSMTDGIISQIGRTLSDKREYDQSTVPAFPGSSGGGLYLTNGAYVGMLVRGAGETFNLFVPQRRIKKWAESCNIEWAIDSNVPMPSEEDLRMMEAEDVGVKFDDPDKEAKEFPYLIRISTPK